MAGDVLFVIVDGQQLSQDAYRFALFVHLAAPWMAIAAR